MMNYDDLFFYLSNHMLVATRTQGGKLHLVPEVGRVPLQDATLIEDPNETMNQDDDRGIFYCFSPFFDIVEIIEFKRN